MKNTSLNSLGTKYEIIRGDGDHYEGDWYAVPIHEKGDTTSALGLGPFHTPALAQRAVLAEAVAEMLDASNDEKIHQDVAKLIVRAFTADGDPHQLAVGAVEIIDEKDCIELLGYNPFQTE